MLYTIQEESDKKQEKKIPSYRINVNPMKLTFMNDKCNIQLQKKRVLKEINEFVCKNKKILHDDDMGIYINEICKTRNFSMYNAHDIIQLEHKYDVSIDIVDKEHMIYVSSANYLNKNKILIIINS